VNGQDTEIWRKLLSNGDLAVAFLNLGDRPVDITAEWADIGLKPGAAVHVRDLWQRKDIGSVTQGDRFTATMVPSHGTVLTRMAHAQ